MKDPRLDRLAQTLIEHSCQLSKGEKVLIEAFDLPEPSLVCRLIELAAERGAYPFVSWKNNAILRTLYGRARDLYTLGREDAGLRRGLTMRGYGEWTLDNVYAFVFETSVDLPGQGHRSFVGEIREADFVEELVSVGTIGQQ